MTSTPVPVPARRRTGFALVLVALALAAGAAWGVRGALAGRAATAREAARRAALPRVTHQTVLGEVRSVARLATAEATLRDVVTVEQTNRFWATKRVLLVVTGRVGAGMDLARDSARVTVDTAARRVAVELPPAELLTVEVLDVHTYDERAGLLNPWRPADRDAVQREVRAQLERAGRDARLLDQADRNAAALLRALLARDGYAVEVSVRPRAASPTRPAR
jgi:hypothetical protein